MTTTTFGNFEFDVPDTEPVHLNFGPIGIVGRDDAALVSGAAPTKHPMREARVAFRHWWQSRRAQVAGRHAGEVVSGVCLTRMPEQRIGAHAYGARYPQKRVVLAKNSVSGRAQLVPGTPQVDPVIYYADRARVSR